LQELPRYPIRAAAKLTGVPVDTLRAWERRYAVVAPQRDRRGRMYSEGDVRKLKLLRVLVERGHPIGRLAQLSEEQLGVLHVEAAEPPRPLRADAVAVDLEAVVAALERFDGTGAERELRRLAALLRPREFVREVALPLMRRVGDDWFAGRLSVAQEHLASAVLRNLLGSLVRAHTPEEPRVSLLFATATGEGHEFGILAAAMLAVGGGVGAVYLGPDLPPHEIAIAARRTQARVVVLGVIGARGTAEALAGVRQLATELPRGVELWVGGPALPDVQAALRDVGGTHLPDFDAFEEQLQRLGARR
jgi:DNA-binding transcriptional MerR regulator/methylmalonyl-CoA mutase cobalamin-binding subunit